MKYVVVVTKDAVDQIAEAYDWLVAQTPQHAPVWHNGILDAIDSLEESPERCALVPEDEDNSGEIRQLLFGSKRHAYRIIFVIRGQTVSVLQVLHAARRGLS